MLLFQEKPKQEFELSSASCHCLLLLFVLLTPNQMDRAPLRPQGQWEVNTARRGLTALSSLLLPFIRQARPSELNRPTHMDGGEEVGFYLNFRELNTVSNE